MVKRMKPLLGTFVEISADARSPEQERAVERAFERISFIQSLLSFQDPTSDLSRLNANPGSDVELHAESIRVLRLAHAMTVASGGLFNCTVAGRLVREKLLPCHGGQDMVDAGSSADFFIARKSACLNRAIRITLDGIAKGYAVDLAVGTLKRAGIGNGVVNAGGDLRVFGAITVPVFRREASGRFLHLGNVQNVAVATSVVPKTRDASFPGAILNNDGLAPYPGSWTVLAKSAWRADALTKIAALAAPCVRNATIDRLGGYLCEGPQK